MTALESAENLIALARDADGRINAVAGATPDMIDAAEQQLGLLFPSSYRRVVAELGSWDVAGVDFLGIYQTPAMGDQLLGSVRETLDARTSFGLPASMIVIMLDDLGLVVLDTSALDDDGEAPVLSWTPDGRTEHLGDNFGDYALQVCAAAVDRA